LKYMLTYDLMESARNTNQWLGATARAWGAYPLMAATGNPLVEWIKAWGEVTERTFARMVVKPDWGISAVTGDDGRDHTVRIETLVAKPFGNLIHFRVPGRQPRHRRVLLVAPMSGHYATLLRKTVISLLPECEVFITDWHNARDGVPDLDAAVSALIIAEVAVEPVHIFSDLARQLLVAFLDHVREEPVSELDAAVALRQADPGLLPAEVARLTEAARLVRSCRQA